MKHLRQLLRRRYHGRAIAFSLIYVMFVNMSLPVAWAGPEGAQVINGEVSIQQSAYNTAITASDKAIINYSSFDITRPETVQFIQPSSSASVLNRILSASPTNINGTLLANGRVFFVNPAGIYIGAGARINVNQLVASGLNISNSDFINGRYDFAGGDGSVINSGDISAEQVYLIGKQVTNSGNISCPIGCVVMAAGDRVFLGEPGSEIVVEIDESSLSEPADTAGSGAGVLNEGAVEAAGGIIALAAAGDIYSQAISNVGSLSTSIETGDAGEVRLIATEGTVINSGSIEAASSSGAGGTVQMLGDRVGLFDAGEIDVSGSDGGGTVLIGGDYQGEGNVPTASRTYVSPDSTIRSDATENGDGGKVIVWADEITRFYGNISARGGAGGGDGGFVEVSGKDNLGFYGYVDTLAPKGNIGALLLDPADIVIEGGAGASSGLGDVDAFDDAGASLTITEATLEAAGASVTLQAENSITVSGTFNQNTNGEGTGSIVRLGNNHDLTMDTRNATGEGSGGIDLTGVGVEFQTQGTGDITIRAGITGVDAGGDAGSAPVIAGRLTTLGSGGIALEAEGGVTVSGALSSGSGSVDIDAGGTLAVNAGIGTSTGDVTLDSTGVTTVAAAGDITAGGAVTFGAEKAGTLTTAGDVVTSDDNVTFTNAVTANGGSPQSFDAGTGTLLAGSTITKTGGTDLTLSGNLIDLDGAVVVQTGNLTVTGSVEAEGSLQASGALHLQGTVNELASDVVGVGITFDHAVTADGGGPQSFDAGIGTLSAGSTITKTGAGGLTLSGATSIDLNATVDVQDGSLTLGGSTSVAADQTLQASSDVILAAGILTGEGALTLEATGGGITAGVIDMRVDDTTLTLSQNEALDMASFSVTNAEHTNLVADSTGGSVTSTTADGWRSIAATAENNIELSGSGDIRIASAGLDSTSGGVKVISAGGTISTPGAGGALDAPINGFSNQALGIGVGLPSDEAQKAAVVIRSPSQDLRLGAGATLTARGSYDPGNDDRPAVDFDDSLSEGGDPIDVAVYLGSYEPPSPSSPYHDVAANSRVSIADNGTMVIDADETVTFGNTFKTSDFGPRNRLEVVSRISTYLEEVIENDRLPYARYPAAIRNAFAAAGGSFAGAYVLRGKVQFAETLDLIEPVPWAPPRPLELETGGEVEGPDTEALEKLLNELGIGVQPYVTEAYAASLSTDLRLYSAAEKLQRLIPILEDAEGTGIAALRATVAQFFPSLDALSEEQVSSFGQELLRHKGDGTDYDAAGKCIFSLTEYVTILGSDIGWPVEKSVGFVMGRYVPRLAEGDEIRIAVIQMHLQKAVGV